VSDAGVVATPRKAFVALDAALSHFPQGIRVADSKFLGAYRRTNTDIYARPMNIAADGTVTGLAQATTQIANLNANPSSWIHLKDNWFILAIAGPGVALNLCAIECEPDGTINIPANNTFQVNADKGTDPQMLRLDDDMVGIFSRDSGNNAWLSTVDITAADPVVWSNHATKSLGATLTKGSGIKKVLIPEENEKDLKDIPSSISKQVEIVLVTHMDEVLSHALIIKEGDTLFKEDDILLDIMPKGEEEEKRTPLI